MSCEANATSNPVGCSTTSTSDIAESNQRCLKLAIEGEKSCRAQDHEKGIGHLQSALLEGTDDPRTLSAIYSQLGNAYFYTGDYMKAMEFHRHDLQLAKLIQDPLGEAKACGNLGNTYKVLGKYDEAVYCCLRHLDLSRSLGDKVSESRALYNLGNVYHAKGKYLGRLSAGASSAHMTAHTLNTSLHSATSHNTADEVRLCLTKAVDYFKQNLQLVEELQDRAAIGRAWGNLGNTLYLLADFGQAVQYHNKRLELAKEFGDKHAMRRAYSNLANAYVFLGDFAKAVEYYKLSMQLAVELAERATEAQVCYSLGNTFTLMQQYDEAIDFHHRHLSMARQLGDRVGEARASWSLGNVHLALQQLPVALYYTLLHFNLSNEIGDDHGERMARENLERIRQQFVSGRGEENATALLRPDNSKDPQPMDIDQLAIPNQSMNHTTSQWLWRDRADFTLDTSSQIVLRRRASMDKLNVIGDAGTSQPRSVSFVDVSEKAAESQRPSTSRSTELSAPSEGILRPPKQRGFWDEDFLDLLSRVQGKRINDQRADVGMIGNDNKENRQRSVDIIKANTSATQPSTSTTSMACRLRRRWSVAGDAFPTASSTLQRLVARAPRARTWRRNLKIGRIDEHKQLLLSSADQSTLLSHSALARGTSKRQSVTSITQFRPAGTSTPTRRRRSWAPNSTSASDCSALLSTTESESSVLSDSDCTTVCERRPLLLHTHCRLNVPDGYGGFDTIDSSTLTPEQFMELVVGMQARRMDDQRAFLPGLHNPELVMASNRDDGLIWTQQPPPPQSAANSSTASSSASSTKSKQKSSLRMKLSDPSSHKQAEASGSSSQPVSRNNSHKTKKKLRQDNEDFFEMLIRCQDTRIDDQRAELRQPAAAVPVPQRQKAQPTKALTLPDDDFFQELMAAQNNRYDDQRSSLQSNSKQRGS